MKYPLHTTTMEMRKKLFERGEFEIGEIKIDDFLTKTIAIDEDGGELYEVDYSFMLDTLSEYDNGLRNFEDFSYYKHWIERKGYDYCRVRITNFFALYDDIRANGLKEPVAVTITGQKLDGSHRSAIIKHLGHATIPARVYHLTKDDIDLPFIKRTLEARYKIYGKNYYFIDYGGFTNIPEKIPVYAENSYDRWEVLKDLIVGKTLDLGCNEGFLAVQQALRRFEVVGYDHDFIDGANFNKLIFEYLNKRKLPVSFFEGDITEQKFGRFNTCLLLNVIYHVPQEKQVALLKSIRADQIILQGNLRKQHERDRFRGCDVEGIRELAQLSGREVVKVIEWRDKPIVIIK